MPIRAVLQLIYELRKNYRSRVDGTGKLKVLQEVLADLKRENQIVHFHLISVPIAKAKIDITLTTTNSKLLKR